MKYVLFFLISVYIGVVFADAGQYQQRAVLGEPEQLIQTDTALELQPQRSIQAYQNVISELESDHGAFDPRIGEALLSIGKLYRAQGRHKDAVNVLNRALHISKVSGGLYNLAQIGIIDLIIDSNSELQDWEELAFFSRFVPGMNTLLKYTEEQKATNRLQLQSLHRWCTIRPNIIVWVRGKLIF